jgi:hypothetical protein
VETQGLPRQEDVRTAAPGVGIPSGPHPAEPPSALDGVVLTDVLTGTAEITGFLLTAWAVAAGVDRCLRRNRGTDPAVAADPADGREGAYVDSDGVLTPAVPRQRDRRSIMAP